MIYRDYRRADFRALCRIDRDCFPPGIAYPPQDLAYWMRMPGAFVIVAEDDERSAVAGFLLAQATRKNQGHIVTIDVLEEYRAAGVGTALLDRAHQRLKERGVDSVWLEVSVENQAAIRFYQKHGYRQLRRIPRYYLDRIDAWVMRRDF